MEDDAAAATTARAASTQDSISTAKSASSIASSSGDLLLEFFFVQLHSVKRNSLDRKKLNDLVFIKYNYKLKERYTLLSRAITSKKKFDPLELNDNEAGTADEWLIGGIDDAGDEEVIPGEGLTWRAVEEASVLDVPLRNTRTSRSSTHNVDVHASSSSKAPQVYSRSRGGGRGRGRGGRGDRNRGSLAPQVKQVPSPSTSMLVDDIYNEPEFEEDDDDDEGEDNVFVDSEDDDFSGDSRD